MGNRLAGKRILIVEDEYFIASDLKRALVAEDAVVLGPVADLDRGLSLAGEAAVDAAVLDVNLEGSTSFGIADRLAGLDVPYMFLTGYDAWALPAPYRDAPRITKPYLMETVLTCVGQLVGGSARP